MGAIRAPGRRVVVIMLSVVLVAAAAVTAVLFWPRSTPARTATGPSTVSSTAARIADPPVAAATLRIKPVAAAGGRKPTAARVAARLAPALADPGMAQYRGIVVDPATNAVLWNKESGTPTQPASSLKLLTGAALLTKANPDSRLVTRVVQGEQVGDIVFVGGGDVTLSARSVGVETVYPGAPTVADLAAQIRATGVPVKRILLDTGYWTGGEFADGWDATDIAQGFTTRMQALMVDGDRKDPSREDSPRTGEPSLNAGRALARALGDPNTKVTTGTAGPKAKVLAAVYSQPLSTLLAQALLNSDNVLAESLARQVAMAMGGAPSFDGATQAVKLALGDLKLDTIGLDIFDGSGLSHKDQAPAALLADVLVMAVSGKVPAMRGLLAGLPVAGVSGTLKDRFRATGAKAGRGWVRAKTGSLDSTYVLAGYVPDVDGHLLVFALNATNVDPALTRPAQDVFAAALRECGCS